MKGKLKDKPLRRPKKRNYNQQNPYYPINYHSDMSIYMDRLEAKIKDLKLQVVDYQQRLLEEINNNNIS
jgi:hypothetical protein